MFKTALVFLGLLTAAVSQAHAIEVQDIGFGAPTVYDHDNVDASKGDIIYDTFRNGFYGYDGTSWSSFGATGIQSIQARYTTTAGQSISNGSTPIIVDFGTSDYDTNSAVTTGASWKFTAPVAGKYAVSARVTFAAASFTAGNGITLDIYKNGSFFQRIGTTRASVTGSASAQVWGNEDISLNANDYVDIRVTHAEGSARSILSTAGYNSVSIHKIN